MVHTDSLHALGYFTMGHKFGFIPPHPDTDEERQHLAQRARESLTYVDRLIAEADHLNSTMPPGIQATVEGWTTEDRVADAEQPAWWWYLGFDSLQEWRQRHREAVALRNQR